MLQNYVIYNTTTGKIEASLLIETENDTTTVTNNTGVGEAAIAGDGDGTTHYVTGGVITPKVLFTASNTWSATTITTAGTATFGSSIPTGTSVTVTPNVTAIRNGASSFAETTINEGEISFSSPYPGDYVLTFSNEPVYAVYTQTITVTEP